MNRRSFLRLLGMGAAGAVVAPMLPAVAIAAAPPAAIVVGGLEGYQYWQINANSGTFAGIDRAKYPGRLSTPTINANGAYLHPEMARRFIELQRRSWL